MPWARASLRWRSIITGGDLDLGTYSFSLVENPWLAAAAVSVAALTIAGLAWRRRAALVGIAGSILLIGCATAYIIGLIDKAFDFLGLYESFLELVRSFPLLGPLVESVIRERLVVDAVPHAGFIVFFAAAALMLTGGIFMARRNRRWRGLGLPIPPGRDAA